MAAALANPFWDYSLEVYQREAVAKACLALQDRLQLDVNLLLFCCWTGEHGHQLSEEQVRRCLKATGEWQREILAPLRGLRGRLKGDLEVPVERRQSLRAKLRDLELDAERIEQDVLFETVTLSPAAERGAEVAALNLSTYLLAAGIDLSEEDLELLGGLLDAAFAEAAAEDDEPRLL